MQQEPNFTYVILDGKATPKLVQDKEELVDTLLKCNNPEIRSYYTIEEAKAFISHHIMMSNSQASARSRDEPIVGIKKIKLAEKSDDGVDNSSSKSKIDEESKASDEKSKSKEEKELLLKGDVYRYFKENQRAFDKAKPDIKASELYTLNFDGGSKGNPGPAGCGYVIYGRYGEIYTNAVYLGTTTNNQAEYSGMLFGIVTAVNLGIKRLEVRGDSNLVIKQMMGEWKINKKELEEYNKEAKSLALRLDEVSYKWVPREENSEADKLANEGIRSRH